MIASQIEDLFILLKRFSNPCHLSDTMQRFGRSRHELCFISNEVMGQADESFQHLLTIFEQQLLQIEQLEQYAHAVSQQSQAIDNC